MPNWCSTKLEVIGESGELSRFLTGLKKDQSGAYQLLESYYPCPEALHITASFGTSDPELNAQYNANMALYGHSHWYDWCNEKWGTKWGDCDTRLVDFTKRCLTFYLQSAWSPITTGLLEVSTQFPELSFVMLHDEEAGYYLCAEVIRNGETVYEIGCSPCDEYVWEQTEGMKEAQDSYDAYDAWKENKLNEYRDIITALIETANPLV